MLILVKFTLRRIIKAFTIFAMIFVASFGLIFIFKSGLRFMYPLKYAEIVDEASDRYGVEKEVIYAIIKCESGFDENAKSHAGACGLMQITPETFEWLNKNSKKSLSELAKDIHDPKTNIFCGTAFIAYLMKKYSNEIFALCAYNAGMSAADRWIKDNKRSGNFENLDFIQYPETKRYVGRVERTKKMYKKLYFE